MEYATIGATKRTTSTKGTTMNAILIVKFFQTNDNFYARTRDNGNVIDTTCFYGNSSRAEDYIKNIMTWGYDRSEIEFVIDPTIPEMDVEIINRALDIYAQ